MGMKPKQYKDFMKATLTQNPEQAIMVMGSVGIGKSQTTKQIADELGWEFVDIRLSLLDVTDLRGLPDIDKEKRVTYWTKPTFLPDSDDDTPRILFFDEFSNANASMQNGCLQLTLDREIGEYKLPKNTRVVCAGNGLQDGAYVFKLSSALNNRFINVEFEPDFNDWKEWAYSNKINPLVMGFHNYTNGRLLHNYNNDTNTKAFATPRSWSFVSKILDLGLTNGTLYEAIKGAIGEGAGTEFYGFMKIYRDLPNPKDILQKGKDIIPKESNITYALISALINEVRENSKYVDRLIEYSLKIEKEFSVVLIKDLLKTELKNKVISSDKFNLWAKENEKVII